MNDNAIKALREALTLSPDNVPLRQHLGDTLMALARYTEAAQEYRYAYRSLAPDHAGLKLGLAGRYSCRTARIRRRWSSSKICSSAAIRRLRRM